MLAPWKESYDKPRQSIKKQRHHFADKGPYNQSYGFSSSHIQIWELDHKEGWGLNNWCFWILVLEKALKSPLDCKESTLKEISPQHSLEGMLLKLKLRYLGHLIRRVDSLEKTLMLEKIEGKRWRGQERMRLLDSIIDSMDMNLNNLQERVKDRGAWHATQSLVIQLLSPFWLFVASWTATCQASLSFTISQSLYQVAKI